MANRLGWAQARLEAAERERIWAIASAHTQGLSIRKIAAATTLSSSRVHQLLHADEADQIPEWLNSLSTEECPTEESAVVANNCPALSDWQRPLANEVELVHQCIGWLEQLGSRNLITYRLRGIEALCPVQYVLTKTVLYLNARPLAHGEKGRCCINSMS